MLPLREISLTLIAAASTNVSAAIIAAATTPGANDVWAAVGAMLGTLIPVAESRKKDRTTWHLACVIIASWFTGATAPAIGVHLVSPEMFALLSWQFWAMLGFIGALLGWSVMHATYNLGPWIGRRLTGEVKHRLGGDPDIDQPPGR